MSPRLMQLQERSASSTELVLSYADASLALDVLEVEGALILGWEGWLRYPDRRLGHSEKYQGTTQLAHLSSAAAYDICRATIRSAYEESRSSPEGEDGELLFCLTYDS